MNWLLPLAPALLLVAAVFGFARPHRTNHVAQWCALAAFVALVVAAVALARGGATTFVLADSISFRLDIVSITMALLVGFIGWVVVRFSTTYLVGESRQGVFAGWLTATLALVLLLVTSGNLIQLVAAWIATSLTLHRLLLFYPDRVAARRAARKKFVTARAGDVALVGGSIALALSYGTTDIATIDALARSGGPTALTQGAAALLALAAVLKSAQFPTHGWLTEVMEAPTPVSALLHAGVINAGGFVLIRFADVMLHSPTTLAVLILLGGFTAIFGGVVMLTQSAVKTSLAWSTVAQMGFMIMQCGLALFPLALLHIVAHSLYKAHSFLASGGAVERVTAARRLGPVAIPGAGAVGRAFVAALAIYTLMGLSFGFQHKSPQAIALGAILIFGVAYLIAQGLAGAAPSALTRRVAFYAFAASLGYFALHAIAALLTHGTLPPAPGPGPLEWALIVLAVLSFALVAVAQSLFPLWSSHPAAAGLRVHISNGFYANAVFDRWLGGWQRGGSA